MKSCTGMILLLLGLLFKASSGENSTQVYFLELRIEDAAYEYFTLLLKNLVLNLDNSATVTNITITTDCIKQKGMIVCTCDPNSSWSDEVCNNNTDCCNRASCNFPDPDPSAMCLSKNRVVVRGSFTMNTITYPPEDAFIQNYTTMLEEKYSTLGWFDSLRITGLRPGSVIADFVMSILQQFNVSELERITNDLQKKTSGYFNLTVTGFTHIFQRPPGTVPYNITVELECSTSGDLKNPIWLFQKNKDFKHITNGTEATVKSFSKSSNMFITAASKVWKGTFRCEYRSGTSDSIIYMDSLDLDIALLPQILIISEPQFPDCKKQKYINTGILCIVPNTTEKYTVTWTGGFSGSNDPVPQQNGQLAYQAGGIIDCNTEEEFNVSCTFTNRLNHATYANLTIPIIQKDSVVCQEENGWPQTKSNFSAIKFCISTDVGLERRQCLGGKWQNVRSECVNRVLYNLLTETQEFEKGIGAVETAVGLISSLKQTTEQKSTNTFPNVNASVDVLQSIQNAIKIKEALLDMGVFPDFVKSSSNLLNGSLNESWKDPNGNYTLALTFLFAVEGFITQTNLTSSKTLTLSELIQENVKMTIYNTSDPNLHLPNNNNNNFSVEIANMSGLYVQTAMMNLASKLPNTLNGKITDPSDVILSVVIIDKNSPVKIRMKFTKIRLPNHEMYCVFMNTTSQWSDEGCKWGGADNPDHCECDHLSTFTILMSKEPIELLYMEELTYAGLGFSIGSLSLCLVIEFLVWNSVVKSNIAHFRHTVLVNIMVSLLIADCSFLAAPLPSSSPSNWCLSLTVMKHFCFLAVFFWMLCLSLGLLHQVIFVFVHLRKKVYLGLCFFLGYVCPLVIVVVTFISNNNGETGSYYSTETCWLIYDGVLKGSIHAFLFPVFVIVFVNMFTMAVVLSRIIKPTLSEGSSHDEKEVARSIVKTVVLLTPTLGITWILGLFMLMLDLTKQPYAQIVNYAFTFFNSFQGFFILLTGCFGEKKVRDALRKRFRPQPSANYKSESSTRITSTTKTK